jgi:hypothetical protein
MDSIESNKSSGLKAIIILLSLLLIGSLGYVYKISQDAKVAQNILVSEKIAVLKDLSIAKDSLNIAIASNTNLSEELIAERDKIQLLIADVDKSRGDAKDMVNYKTDANKIKDRVATLMRQVLLLKNENKKLIKELDITAVKLGAAKTYTDTLVKQNSRMAIKIEKAAKLSILNLQSSAIRQKSSGKQIETDKASKADVLKISFMIAENKMAKSGDKTYYIQVIDSKGNVLGDKQTESFKSMNLTYSFISTVKYENKTVKIEKDLPVSDVQPGIYYINIYDNGELITKYNFTLK